MCGPQATEDTIIAAVDLAKQNANSVVAPWVLSASRLSVMADCHL